LGVFLSSYYGSPNVLANLLAENISDWNQIALLLLYSNFCFHFIDDFGYQPVAGLLCIFSLKNPETPEYEFETHSGAMCVALHPRHPNLVAAGCHDGSVQVQTLHSEIIYLKSVLSYGNQPGDSFSIIWSFDFLGVQPQGRQLQGISCLAVLAV
jgi:hypothetical protein